MKTEANNQGARSRKEKVIAGSNPEITKLKDKWKLLPDDDRMEWLVIFQSSMTQKKIRERIREKLEVILIRDVQMTRFRRWAGQQELNFLLGKYSEKRRAELLAAGKSLAEVQQILLKEASDYCLDAKDFNLALKASSEITKFQNMELNWKKFYFKASEAALKHVDKIKVIAADTTMSDADKIDAVRRELFGIEEVEE